MLHGVFDHTFHSRKHQPTGPVLPDEALTFTEAMYLYPHLSHIPLYAELQRLTNLQQISVHHIYLAKWMRTQRESHYTGPVETQGFTSFWPPRIRVGRPQRNEDFVL